MWAAHRTEVGSGISAWPSGGHGGLERVGTLTELTQQDLSFRLKGPLIGALVTRFSLGEAAVEDCFCLRVTFSGLFTVSCAPPTKVCGFPPLGRVLGEEISSQSRSLSSRFPFLLKNSIHCGARLCPPEVYT